MGRRWILGAVLISVLAGVTVGVAPVRGEEFAEECAEVQPGVRPKLTVGAVDCLRLDGRAYMGGLVPVSYYIPEACRPVPRTKRCPVLYYTHGTLGSYQHALGVKGNTSSRWVKALTSGPPVDPSHVADPWTWEHPSTWVPMSPIDMIIVVPHGATLPGGFGPSPHQDTAWTDWNPRYAKDGDTPRYPTPPPRPESFILEQLVPFVDASFPAIADRTGRAIVGTSQGGFGGLKLGLAHPDVWSSMGMVSGGGFPLPMYERIGIEPPAGISPPAPVPHTPLPGAVPALVPDAALQQPIVPEVTVGFGDPVADQAYWRYASPPELISNARASAGGVQSVHIRSFVNDTIPRRAEDFANPETYATDQGFESILFPTNLYMEQLYDANGVEREFEVHPGLHSVPYWAPFYRQQLAAQYANLRHRDGTGSPRPMPTIFDYRTIKTSFDIWGWHLEVDRASTEFVNLTAVTCDGFTIRGTGVVDVTPPPSCGRAPVRVDLGPSQATDEPMGLGSSPAYGQTRKIVLQPSP